MKLTEFITRSIKSKLILYFLIVSIIPLTFIGLLSYYSAKSALQKSIDANIASVVSSRAKHIENFLTVSLDVVNSASSLSLFRENLYNIERGKEIEKSRKMLDEAMESWQAQSNVFYRAKILNLNGDVIATTKSVLNDMGTNRAKKDNFLEGLKGPFISDPYISPDDNIPGLAYSCPVFAPGSKTEVIGVLVIHQATEASLNGGTTGKGLGINQIISNSDGMGNTGETYLVNRDGLFISNSRLSSDVFLKKSISVTSLTNLLSNSGDKVYSDYRGILTVGKAVPIMGVKWNLLCEFDYKEAYSPIISLGNRMLVIFLVIIMLVIAFAWYIAKNLTAPIKYLTNIAQAMTLGDLNQHIKFTGIDETGLLAQSFRTLQDTMNEKAELAREISEGNLMLDVKPLSDKDTMGNSFVTMIAKLRSQLKDISEGINVLAASSSEIMASVTQLASSSAETATSVSETTSTVEEVKQTAIISNQKAKVVSDNASQMAVISRDGARAVGNTIEGMNKIKQQMNAISAMVVRLSEQSQTIGEITATVNELAEQSNLLSVNAAIEAAKAGEHGKGFTVVAQEIKVLANRSKEATAQVKTILRDVQKSISSAVMATEEGGRAVEEGLKLTNLSGDTIRSLSESVNEASNVAIQIAASSQQQLEGMDQVVTAMENIREASMQTVISTQQSVDSVNELQKVGQKLDELMKQYKLGK